MAASAVYPSAALNAPVCEPLGPGKQRDAAVTVLKPSLSILHRTVHPLHLRTAVTNGIACVIRKREQLTVAAGGSRPATPALKIKPRAASGEQEIGTVPRAKNASRTRVSPWIQTALPATDCFLAALCKGLNDVLTYAS